MFSSEKDQQYIPGQETIFCHMWIIRAAGI